MKTLHDVKKPALRAGGRRFAAVCLAAIAAFGMIACSGRSPSMVAPVPLSGDGTPPSWPIAGGDPSLPSAAEALAGRLSEPAEPAPTF